MDKLTSITNTVAGRASLAGAAAMGASGVVQIFHSQSHTGNRVVGVSGHLAVSFFILGLVALAPVFVALGRRAGTTLAARAGLAVGAAMILLAAASVVSDVDGRDPAFFDAVAILVNAVWLVGSVTLATCLARAKAVPVWVAAGLVVAFVAAMPLATLGGGVVCGAYFAAVGYLLVSEGLVASARAVTA